MGKSVNDYYAEKMKKLLEMQNDEKNSPRIAAPQKKDPAVWVKKNGFAGKETVNKEETSNRDGREYYDKFRSTQKNVKHRWKSPEYTADSMNPQPKTEKAPEQTLEDKQLEEEKREEAQFLARKGRKNRRVKDTVISVILILLVTAVLSLGIYKLVFVVSEISVEGNSYYSAEEIIEASGISEGANLYSFRNSTSEKNITLKCPMVGKAQIDKVAPATVKLMIEEEKKTFYADFYGEYRELSENFRVMYSTNKEKATNEGLIFVKLPAVGSVLSGETPQFTGVRSDDYIYEVIESVKASPLFERLLSMDLRNKYSISLNCDGKYLIILGDSESLSTKLKIVEKVLEDSMFQSDDKVKINVSDLKETSVITDNKMVLD